MARTPRSGDKEPARGGAGLAPEVVTRMCMVVDLFDTKSAAAKAARITPEQLSRQLKGLNRPFFDTVLRLCESVGVSLDWLMTGDGPMRAAERAAWADRLSAPDEREPFSAEDEALLGNVSEGLDHFMIETGYEPTPAERARMLVLFYRILARRRMVLRRLGEDVPPELTQAGHPFDFKSDTDIRDILMLNR